MVTGGRKEEVQKRGSYSEGSKGERKEGCDCCLVSAKRRSERRRKKVMEEGGKGVRECEEGKVGKE